MFELSVPDLYIQTVSWREALDYIFDRFNKTELDVLPKCRGNEPRLTRRQYKQDSKIQFVYDSVYAMAYALDKLLRDECSNISNLKACARTLKIDGQRFYKEYILNVSFIGMYLSLSLFLLRTKL